jgi:hypothetical protein
MQSWWLHMAQHLVTGSAWLHTACAPHHAGRGGSGSAPAQAM